MYDICILSLEPLKVSFDIIWSIVSCTSILAYPTINTTNYPAQWCHNIILEFCTGAYFTKRWSAIITTINPAVLPKPVWTEIVTSRRNQPFCWWQNFTGLGNIAGFMRFLNISNFELQARSISWSAFGKVGPRSRSGTEPWPSTNQRFCSFINLPDKTFIIITRFELDKSINKHLSWMTAVPNPGQQQYPCMSKNSANSTASILVQGA